MAFRRLGKKSPEEVEFLQWIKDNRVQIEKIGLPNNVVESRGNWHWFLQEGSLQERDNSLFEVEDLNFVQKVALLRLLFDNPSRSESTRLHRLTDELIRFAEAEITKRNGA